jgi:hypothetical protein
VHLFSTELIPDFQPTSEVIRLILNSVISSSNMILISFLLSTEHHACPSGQGDRLQCSRPNLSIGIQITNPGSVIG